MVGEMVAHADGAHLPGLVGLFERTVATVTVTERLMQDHQVDVVCTEFAEALVDALLAEAVLAHPHLRHDKDVFALHTRLGNRLADLLLIVVGLGSVNHAVACFQGIKDAPFTLFRSHLIHSVSDLRHLYAVAQFHSWNLHMGLFIYADNPVVSAAETDLLSMFDGMDAVAAVDPFDESSGIVIIL